MSSFKKRVPASGQPSSAVPPPGSRVSAYNSSVLLSTGIASLDDILGGGCPLGSLLLLEEDKDTSYAKLLLKYWIAQGICCERQRILLLSSSLDQSPREVLSKLPFAEAADREGKSTSANSETHTDDEDDVLAASAKENMKIAFRYEGLKKFETSVKNNRREVESEYCSTFDLTKVMDVTDSTMEHIEVYDVDTGATDGLENEYAGALAFIDRQLQIHAVKSPTQALRIAIQSLGSLAWGECDIAMLFRFLINLRTLLRQYSSFSSAVVTMPGYLIRQLGPGPAGLRRLEWACDAVVELESFAGSPTLATAFPTYSGLLHVHRLPTPNSLLPPSAKLSVLRGLAPGSNSTSSGAGGMDNNLGFKLKRRRGLIVETLHLDEGGGTSERRTKPPAAESHSESPASRAPGDHSHPIAASQDVGEAVKPSEKKKKFERRKIRFDDDPNENPSGILGGDSSSKTPSIGLQRDKPELYEF